MKKKSARKGTRPRKATARKSAVRPAVKARVKPRGPSGSVRVRAVEKAIRTVGARKLKPGPIKVSSAPRFVGVSKRGTRSKSVGKVLDAVARHPGEAVYSYTVTTKFRRRSGKMDKVVVSGVGVPTMKSAALRRRKGETTKQALKRLVRQEIERTVHVAVRGEWGRYELGDTTSKMGRRKARRILSNVKARERASFKVEFYREGAPSRKR